MTKNIKQDFRVKTVHIGDSPMISMLVNPKLSAWTVADAWKIASMISDECQKAQPDTDQAVHVPGRVEFRPAFAWTCDECGMDNFENAIIETINDEDYLKFLEQNPDCTAPQQDIQRFLLPHVVQCGRCNTEYESEEFNADFERGEV